MRRILAAHSACATSYLDSPHQSKMEAARILVAIITSSTACAFYFIHPGAPNLISPPVCRHHTCLISSFVRALISAFKARRELALDNVALRLCLLFIHPPAPWGGSQPCGAKYPGFCADSKGVLSC